MWNPNHQIPCLPQAGKLQINPNNQFPNHQIKFNSLYSSFGYWSLELIWLLVLGIWLLYARRLLGLHIDIEHHQSFKASRYFDIRSSAPMGMK